MKLVDAVSNTSPLIFLEEIDSLYLLNKCFRSIVILEMVMQEWGVNSVPEFIQVKSISDSGKSFVKGSFGRLHRGELEAIRLAIEMNREIVLMDDLLARQFAERHGLICIGVLGILKIAYRLNFLSLADVKHKVGELINKHNLYISPKILNFYWDSFLI